MRNSFQGAQIILNGSLSHLYLQHINAQKEPSYCLLHLPRYARVAFLVCSGAPEAPCSAAALLLGARATG